MVCLRLQPKARYAAGLAARVIQDSAYMVRGEGELLLAPRSVAVAGVSQLLL